MRMVRAHYASSMRIEHAHGRKNAPQRSADGPLSNQPDGSSGRLLHRSNGR
jgi:hypothetical protein